MSHPLPSAKVDLEEGTADEEKGIHPIALCVPVVELPVLSCEAVGNAIITVTATKSSPTTPPGLTFQDHPTAGGVILKDISPASIFHDSNLRVGMKILRINDTDCQALNQQSVTDLLLSCQDEIAIRAMLVDLEEQPIQVHEVEAITPTETEPREDSNAPTEQAAIITSHPPPGAPEGGQWGIGSYFGPSNRLLFCLVCSLGGVLGLGTIGCKVDKQVYYKTPDGKIYNEKGEFVAREEFIKFRPNPPGMLGKQTLPPNAVETFLGPKLVRALVPCGILVFLVWLTILAVVFKMKKEEEVCGWKYCERYDYYTNSFKLKRVKICGEC